MLPHALSSFETLAVNYTFRNYYIKSRQHIVAVANWMSAAAIWQVSLFYCPLTVQFKADPSGIIGTIPNSQTTSTV